jgi:hypothetical protein
VPLELGVWRIDKGLVAVPASPLDLESRLKEILDKDITVANPGWFIIGKEVETRFKARLDLLAIDAIGNLIVIELKRDQTPRDVVAQVLEYGTWVNALKVDEITQIYRAYVEKHHPDRAKESFDQAFCKRFSVKELPDDLNQEHQLVVVASQFDVRSERIVTYLAEVHGVAINAVFFRVFKDGDSEYLTRAWLRDPVEVESEAEPRAPKEWNGEYYCSFGGDFRNWEEARKYGFISGGGGRFYSQTLHMLSPDNRVWVNIPGGTGYVGVGRVEAEAVPIEEFLVTNVAGERVPITDIHGLDIAKGMKSTESEEAAEYLVRVRWDKTVPLNQAIKERGFFGSQHTVARPKDEKWQHTVERLKQRFGIKH